MSLNQDIRFAENAGPNNPKGLYKHVKPSRSIAGSGFPDPSLGEDEWLYIDESTGFEYKKTNGVWDPFVNFASFAPPVVIPDPLPIDAIEGRTSEDILLDLKTGGTLNVSLGAPSQALDINSGNVRLTANGNGTFASDLQGYAVIANNGAGKSITLESNAGIIDHVGLQPFEISNSQPDENLIVSTTGTAGDIQVNSSGAAAVNAAAGDSVVSSATGKVRLNSDSTASGGTVVDGFSLKYENTVVNPGGEKIEISESGITFRTPTGQVSLVNQIAGDFVIAPQPGSETSFNNTGIKSISSINGSDGVIQNSVFNVNNAGALSFRAYPYCVNMMQSGFGANGTSYFHLGTSTINPGELWSICIGNGRNLAEVSLRLHSNALWNFGGGTATLEIGYVANNVPTTTANFTVVRSITLDTVSDFYGVTFSGYNDSIPFRAAFCARMVLAGTAATSTNAELTMTAVLV
jgi:hypothetical protein